jgi:CBS-domain-containing membrane protein
MATAKDVMSTKFHTLLPDIHITEAVKMFKKDSEEEQQKVFGMMIINP